MTMPQDASDSTLLEDGVRTTPEWMLNRELDQYGEEWQEHPEDANAIGFTMFDSAASDDGTVAVLLPKDRLGAVPNQSLVRIRSREDGRSYLGAVVKGPFTEPDGLRADAPVIVTATVRGKGRFFLPQYHGRTQIELMGEELPAGGTVPPRRRPLPNSPVFLLDKDEATRVLRIAGDLRLGLLDGPDEIEVRAPTGKKDVLPRHLGILGTTGGGKSTTVSGMIAQLQQAGVACIILDTEGEYTAINEPTSDAAMQQALERRGLAPAGVDNTAVYHLVGRETANPGHPKHRPFSVQFSELSPHAVKEILDFSSAQEARFFQAYDVCKQALREAGVFPARGNQAEEREALELDEMETGYPRMTLSHLIDVAGVFLSVVSKASGDPAIYNAPLRSQLDSMKRAVQAVKPDSEVSWRTLLSKLWRLQRLQVFDHAKTAAPLYTGMLEPGRVTIIDLSDTDSPQVNNLVIAQILRGVQRQQDENYQEAIAAGRQPNLTMVFIEEAHEFLSAERIKQMPVLFQQVARIARRGRKRWLGLAFITQLPQHLPDEVLGLINNIILHKINDADVIGRLRKSIGGIDKALWDRLPALAPGQAIVSFTHLARPLQVAIDPTPCRLLMAE